MGISVFDLFRFNVVFKLWQIPDRISFFFVIHTFIRNADEWEWLLEYRLRVIIIATVLNWTLEFWNLTYMNPLRINGHLLSFTPTDTRIHIESWSSFGSWFHTLTLIPIQFSLAFRSFRSYFREYLHFVGYFRLSPFLLIDAQIILYHVISVSQSASVRYRTLRSHVSTMTMYISHRFSDYINN